MKWGKNVRIIQDTLFQLLSVSLWLWIFKDSRVLNLLLQSNWSNIIFKIVKAECLRKFFCNRCLGFFKKFDTGDTVFLREIYSNENGKNNVVHFLHSGIQ